MTNEEAIAILIGLLPPPMRCDGKSGQHLIVSLALAKAIEALKSEPKHGRWSKKHNGLRRCSVCKNEVEVREWRNTPLYKYCPYCGAKMDEVDL